MVLNDKSNRPDIAPKTSMLTSRQDNQPQIGIVSLGCPKALVDSERILTRLRAEGYSISPDYAGAEAVIVNTCGFLDSAKIESLEAIGEAVEENGKVIVTGCLCTEKNLIKKRSWRQYQILHAVWDLALLNSKRDAVNEKQTDNRLGGSSFAYKQNYRPVDPRIQPQPYDSIWG